MFVLDSTGGKKNRICVTSESEFKKYLAEGYEVTLIRKSSGGNVEILREIHSSSGHSRSKIITSTIPQDVKDLCGVTEKTFGIKQRTTGNSISSSSAKGSNGGGHANNKAFESLCTASNIERYAALKAACESFKGKNKPLKTPRNEHDIKHEYG